MPNEPVVAVGVPCLEVVPVPSWPSVPLPQHLMESSSKMAQKWNSPPVMAFAVRPVPRLIADAGGLDRDEEYELVPPLPNCPWVSSPQHLTEPSSRRAQTVLKAIAKETAVRPVPNEEIVVGVGLLIVEPMPS